MKADDFLSFDRDAYLAETDRELKLPSGFSKAQIMVESNGNPSAVSPAGAMGLSQVMPKTLSVISKRAGRALDPFNEMDSLYIHREVMRENLGKFKNADDAARAYNGGWTPGTWNNPETSAYVPKIRTAMGTTTKPAAPSYSADAFLDAPDEAQPATAVAATSAPSADAFLDAPDEPAGSVGALDYVKQLGGSIVKSAGDLLTGVGKAGAMQAQADAAAPPVDKFTIAPPKADASVAQAVDAAGGFFGRAGQRVLDTRSDAAKVALENSTPEGDVIQAVRNADASGLSMGKAPTAAGFGLQAANIVGQVLPQVGVAAATRGRSAPAQIGVQAGVGTAQGVGAAVTETREYLGGMSDEQLAAVSPVYRERVAAGKSPAEVRAELLREAEDTVVKYVAPISAVGGAATGALLGKAGGNVLQGAAKGAIARTAVGTVLGATEEAIQEVGEGVAQRKGVNDSTGDTRALGEGSFGEAVLGAAGGAGMGGAKGALTRSAPAPGAVDASTVLDAEAGPAPTLALPAPKITVDSRGNARRDGEPGVADEAPARVVGTTDTSPVRDAVRAELQALGYDATPRATSTPIAVDAEGTARTDADTEVREPGMEPAARVVGRADVDVQPRVAEELRTLGYDGTPRVSPTPISVDPEGNAALQGDTRTPGQANDQRYEAEAAKLHPKSPEARAEYVAAQRQREMGYEARLRDLAEKANAKRTKRKADIEQPRTAPARDLTPTSELGVVAQAQPDGSTTYFFYANPGETLAIKPGANGTRAVASATADETTQAALLRAALADGPLEAAPRALSQNALRKVGATSDRYGTTRLVGKALDKPRMAAELNRMAAKTADGLLAKAPIAGDDMGTARAAIAADPRKAVTILRGKDGEAMIAALRDIAGTTTAQPAPAAATGRTMSPDEDFTAMVTDSARDAVKAGHMTRDEFFAATRAAREGNREAAMEALRKSDQQRGTQSQAVLGGPAENIDTDATVNLDSTNDFDGQFGEPDFMGDASGTLFGAMSKDQQASVSAALRDALEMGVPREWVMSIQGFFVNTPKFPGGLANFFKKNTRGKVVRAISFKETSIDSTIPGASASLAEQQEFRGQLIHELAHNGDFDGQAMRSSADSRLAITTDGSMMAQGEVAQEVFDIYGAQDGSPLSVLFSYPLDSSFDAADSGKPHPAALVQSEIHAQIVRAYFTNRAELERRAPKAYEYARSAIEAKPGNGPDARVPTEVRQERVDPARLDASRSVDRADGRGREDGQDSRPAGERAGAGRLRDQRPGGLSDDSRVQGRPGEPRGREAGRRDEDRTPSSPERAAPLEGYPHTNAGSGPIPGIVAVAERYARDNGIEHRRQGRYAEVDEDRAARIADAYTAMPHAPQDPKVREAYENLVRQTTAQYEALQEAGYSFWFIDTDIASNAEYASSPWNAMRDVRSNKQMGVFPTAEGFGSGDTDLDVADNPLLADTGLRWPVGGPDGELKTVLANDLFRAVHDAFGHGLEGAGFRAQGEENAWQAHARLFTGSALGAITTETRGQNSWLNYGPHGEANRTATVEDTIFADQKTGLMPEWTWREGFDDGAGQAESFAIEQGAMKLTKAQAAVSLERDLYSGSLELIGEKFRTQADLGRFLNARVEKALGGNLVGDYSTKARDFVAGVFAREGVLAMEQSGNAAQWYRDSINGAMENAARLHPEIGTDPNHRFMFSVALAVTSNGSAMDANTRLGFEGYEHWKTLGKLPLKLTGAGERHAAMVAAFKTVNDLIEKAGSVDAVRDFMLSKHPVSEIRSKLAPLGVKVSTAENSTAMVYGGYVLGPKIGAAFLPNMNGKHDALTADRWFSRTFNRVIGGMLDASGATQDVPRSGGERQFMRDVIARAVAVLKRNGYDMEPADLQALLWYPEKELYAFHGVSDKRAAPTDYEQETRKYVEARLQQRKSGGPAAGTQPGGGRRDGAATRPGAGRREVALPQDDLFGEEPATRRSGRVGGDRQDRGDDEAATRADFDAFERAVSKDAGRPVAIQGVLPQPGTASAALASEARDRLGVDVRFFTSADEAVPNGAVTADAPGAVFVRAGSTAARFLVGHELLHDLRRAHPDLYATLRDSIARYTKTLIANEKAIRDDYRSGGVQNVSNDLITEENVADVAGRAFQDPEFWTAFDRASKGDAGKLRQFFRWIGRWFTRTFGPKIDLDAEGGLDRAAAAMMQDVAEAYAELARRKPTVRSIAADMELGVKRSGRAAPVDPPARTTGQAAAAAGVAAIRATAPVTATVQAANKVIDKIGEEMARLTGVKALGEKAVAAAERAVDAKSSWTWLEKVKQGVVADYGLPEEYLDAKLGKQVRENKLMREAKGTLDRLSAMTPDQLAVAYQWLQEKPDTARERELIGKLPADQQDVMRQMKGDIDKLSREALALGLINQETYDRNAMAYVHRSYAKYEAELSGSQAIARQRAQRLKGDQFKGRGMEIEASLERVRGELPENLKGMKVEMLEKRDANGRLTRREYLVQGAKRPASLADYTSAGIWEVRDAAKNGNLKVWRDFSLAERQRMGEIEDARYGFARTMLQGVRDVETSRFLKWAGQKYAKATDAGLEVVEISGAHAALGSQTYTRDQWVKVPDTKIKGTQVHRYGALAGKFVPAIMYSDLTGVMELRNGLWDKMLGAWKISKTALSPGVHVNNVMSNFIMADLADVGVNDIRKALQTIVASKAGDAAAVKLIERYDDSGAESGSFASNEIKTSVIEPLLKQIAESEPEAVQRASLAQVVSLAVHGKLGQAAIAATKTLPGRAIGGTMNGMLKAYQSEDAVFRLAKFMNELDAGKTDMQAGKAARDAFLNYDINAPWVRAARRSVLPFVSFTYRVVPLLAKAVVTKPWKIAKYAALAEALSMLTYAVLGDSGDEEKEKRLLPEEMQGSSLGVPRMIRMPWNDRDNDPLWLDIRRWLPAGDLTETANSKASVPLPSYLSIGGPLSLLIDFYSNTDWRGEKIVKSTDTAGEVVLKVSDVLAKFALPNLPVPGLGFLLREMGAPVDSGQLDPYAWAGIERGLNGAKNGFGKDIQTELQVARALGIKLDPRRLSSDQASIALDAAAKQKQITTDARAIGRRMQRGQIPQEEGERRIAREIEKLKKLGEKTKERLAPEQ